jgi:hypothetical protein
MTIMNRRWKGALGLLLLGLSGCVVRSVDEAGGGSVDAFAGSEPSADVYWKVVSGSEEKDYRLSDHCAAADTFCIDRSRGQGRELVLSLLGSLRESTPAYERPIFTCTNPGPEAGLFAGAGRVHRAFSNTFAARPCAATTSIDAKLPVKRQAVNPHLLPSIWQRRQRFLILALLCPTLGSYR